MNRSSRRSPYRLMLLRKTKQRFTMPPKLIHGNAPDAPGARNPAASGPAPAISWRFPLKTARLTAARRMSAGTACPASRPAPAGLWKPGFPISRLLQGHTAPIMGKTASLGSAGIFTVGSPYTNTSTGSASQDALSSTRPVRHTRRAALFGGVMEICGICRIGIFCRVGRTAAALLTARHLKTLPKNDIVFFEGDTGDSCFYVASGLSVFSALQIRARNPSSFYAAPENCSASRKY